MARDSEPAGVGRVARSTASNNYDEPTISKEFPCPYLNNYSGSASAGNIIPKCCEREFKDLKAVKRHMERIHIKHMSCMSCGLRLGRDMNRHKRLDCKGKNREAKVPEEAINLQKDIQNCKSMQDLRCAIIEPKSNTIVYDYQKEPQAQPINIDEDEDVEHPADTAEVEHPTGDTVEEKSADTAHDIDERAIGVGIVTAEWLNDHWVFEGISSPTEIMG